MAVEVILCFYEGIYLLFLLQELILVYEKKYKGLDLSQQGNLGKWKFSAAAIAQIQSPINLAEGCDSSASVSFSPLSLL